MEKSVYYNRILEKIKEKTPDFEYQNLEIKQIESEVYISLEVNGVSYKTSVYDGHYEALFQNQMRIVGILCLVNKFLSDKGSDRKWYGRWIGVTPGFNKPYYFPSLLSKKELEQIDDYAISSCKPLGTLQIERAIEEMRKLGFFDYLSEKELKEKTMKIQESNEVHHYIDIIKSMDTLILETGIGVQYIEKDRKISRRDNLYIDFIEKLVYISHRNFPAKNIFDTYAMVKDSKATESKFGFELNGKKFEKVIPLYHKGDDRLELDSNRHPYQPITDENIIELVKEAIEKTQNPIQIYNLPYFGYYFLTPAQYQFLKEKDPALFKEK